MSKDNDYSEFGFEEDVNDYSEFGFEEESKEFSLEDAPKEGEPSQLEAAGRGAVQGATLGFGEELGAAALTPIEALRRKISSLIEGTPENIDAQLKAQGFTGDALESGDIYSELRDTAREADVEAKEAHPATYIGSEIAGGIAPALISGGGAAATNILKTGLGQAAKQGAKIGAGQGAVAGLGYSEADLTEGDVLGAAQDVAMGAGTGLVAGAALPLAGKGLKEGAKYAGKKVGQLGDLASSVPLVGETVESFKMAAKGKGVLGKKAYEDIIDKSKTLIKDKLSPFLVSENAKYSSAIGKVMKRVNQLDGKKDISKELHSIEKQVQNLIDSGKVPTEEGKKVLSELTATINNFKKEAVNIVPTKRVDTGVQSAIKSLEKQKNKIIATGKEVGEEFNFTEPKVDLETGVVTMFETRTGRPLSSQIKSGEFTPVKIQSKGQYQKLDADQLKGLKDSAYELMQKAKKGDLGAAKKPVGSLYGLAKEGVTDLAEDASLGGALKEVNKRFSQVRTLDDILPKSLLKGDQTSVNKVAQFMRKAEMEGMSGDDLRDSLKLFSDELMSYDPKFAKEFLKQSDEIAKRYDLARTARQSFGLNLGTGKALGVMAGGALGSAKKAASDVVAKVTSPVAKTMGMVNKLSKEQLGQTAQRLAATDNKGKQHIARQLEKYVTAEGAAKGQLLWALSQNPATRQLIGKEIGEYGEAMDESLGVPSASASDESYVDPNYRTPDSVENIDEGLEHILDVEAGYQNNPKDSGNKIDGKLIGTNRGITPKAYKAFYGTTPTVEDMKALTKEQAIEIYKEDYIKKPGFDKIKDPNLQTAIVDFGIHSGPTRAIKFLQKLIGVKEDGHFGADTLKAIESYEGDLRSDYIDSRREFINKGNPAFIKGWNNRLDTLQEVTAPNLEDGGVVEATDTVEVEQEIDRVNQQQSSGDQMPISHLDGLLEKIDSLNISQESKDQIENEAITMDSYSDGQRLKEMIRKLR